MTDQPTPLTDAEIAAIRERAELALACDEAMPSEMAFAQEIMRLLATVDALEAERGRGCPCLYTTPCIPNCTCVKPGMSHGCRRCCRYGSLEQRTEMAKSIVAAEARAARMEKYLRRERGTWKGAKVGPGQDYRPSKDPNMHNMACDLYIAAINEVLEETEATNG